MLLEYSPMRLLRKMHVQQFLQEMLSRLSNPDNRNYIVRCQKPVATRLKFYLWNTNFEESIFRGKYQCENFGISVDCLRIGDYVQNDKYFGF